MKQNHMIAILIAGILFCIMSSSSVVHATSNLRIILFSSREANIKTYEPFDIWLEIENPDTVGHRYRVIVSFEDYLLGENGFMDANSSEIIYLTLVPINNGSREIRVRLYQDDNTDFVDEGNKTIIVEKNYILTQLDFLNQKTQQLESENSMLNSLTNLLTKVILAMIIAFIAVLAAVVLKMRKKDMV